jgi:general secretion pathway protein N
MKFWQGITLGVIAYLVLLVATAPAARVLPLLRPVLPGVQLSGIDGTVWSGSAVQAVAGNVQLQQLQWKFRPFALLAGTTEIKVRGKLQGRNLRARVGQRWFGHRYLSDVQGAVPAQHVLDWARAKQVNVQGHLEFELEDVRWSEARLPAVAGVVTWSPASVVAPVELAFGTARLETGMGEGGGSRGKLTSSGGNLLVEADVEADPGGDYRLNAQIRQQGDVPQAVANFLSTFTEDRNGSYHFEWSGSL